MRLCSKDAGRAVARTVVVSSGESCIYQDAGRGETLESVGRVVGLVMALAGLGVVSEAAAQGEASTPAALKQLSIEQLMDVEVTSVSKTRESLLGAAAAVATVTGEDIRRSGATTVPEALRFVPGLFVAQEAANSW